MLEKDLLLLQCPRCGGDFQIHKEKLKCSKCNSFYDIYDGIPILLTEDAAREEKTSITYWDSVWRDEKNIRENKRVKKKSEIYLEMAGIFNAVPAEELIGKNVLEVGCGGSLFMDYLNKKIQPANFWGMDISLPGCKLTLYRNPYAKIVCGDIMKPPFRKNSFDFVYSIGLIHHFYSPYDALAAHTNLVKAGGVLFCAAPNLSALPGKILDIFSYKKTMVGITREEMEECLVENGFEIIKSGYIGGLQPFLMLESYGSLDKFSLLYMLFRNIISPLTSLSNALFLFRLNSYLLSPFIFVCGRKISNY